MSAWSARPVLVLLVVLFASGATPARAQPTDRLFVDFFSTIQNPSAFTNFAQPGETFSLTFGGFMSEVPDHGTATMTLPKHFQVVSDWVWQNGNVNDVEFDGQTVTVIIAPGGRAGGSSVNEGRFEIRFAVKVATLANLPHIAEAIPIPMSFTMYDDEGASWMHEGTFEAFLLYQRPTLSCTAERTAPGDEIACTIKATSYPIARPRALLVGLTVAQATDIVPGSVTFNGTGTLGTSSISWDGVGSTPSEVTVNYRLRIRPKEQWPPSLSEFRVPGVFYRFSAQSDYTGNKNDGGQFHRRSYSTTTNDQVFPLPPDGIVVNTTDDFSNHPSSLAADVCDVDVGTPGGQCTLRAAIELANARGGDDVTFDIPGDDTPTIAVTTAFASLPALEESIGIYGDTQPGGRVVLDGLGTAVTGLRVEGEGSVVQGLRITNFSGNGIVVSASDVEIADNVVTGNGLNGVRVEDADTVGVAIRRNDLYDNGGLGIDLAGEDDRDDDVTPNDADDADGGPNGLLNFPVGVTMIDRPDGTTITGVVPGDPPSGTVVDVYAVESIDPSGHGEGRRFLHAVELGDGNAFRLDLDEFVTEPFVTATTVAPDGSTSEFSAVCGDPDDDGLIDSDGDGLCDDWEIDGIDYDADGTFDLLLPNPPYEADPHRKDVYVEIDWMDCSLTTCLDDDVPHQPDVDGLQDVVNAFAAAPVDGGKGVALHLIGSNGLVDEALPEVTLLDFYPAAGVRDDFDDLKRGNPVNACGTQNTDGHFGTPADRASGNCPNVVGAKALVFRYALWGHSVAGDPGTLGIAEIGGVDEAGSFDGSGDDLLIALGSWDPAEPIPGGRRGLDAGVFMHELGHTLGLRHGGEVSAPNCRPNYLSVMSYSLTLTDLDPTRPLDYSRQRLPALNEAALDETRGVQGPAGRNVVFSAPFSANPDAYRIAPASGPIDWDGTLPATATDAVQEINQAPCDEPEELTVQPGFEDWSHLVYGFHGSTDYLYAVRTPPAVPVVEPTVEEVLERAARVDSDADGVSNAADNCPTVSNPGQLDTNDDGLGDACTPASEADVRAVIEADAATAALGAPVTLTITVTNEGPAAAPSVALASAVPSGLTLVSAAPSQGTCTGSPVVSCALGTVAAAQSAVVVLTTEAATLGPVSITAHAASALVTSGDPNPSDNWTTTALAVVAGSTTSTTLAPSSTTTTTTLPPTTTSTVVTTTTTTTVPPPECATEATTASLDCRLGIVLRELRAGAAFGKPQKVIDKKLSKAQALVRRAAAATKAKKTKAALKMARKQMLAAKKMLGGKKVPEETRAAVLALLLPMITDVAAVPIGS